jgi:hypothetical protein
MTKATILQYQQKVFNQYSKAINLPLPYTYPNGNPIRPITPLQTKTNGLMIIGAYPSTRFEYRKAVDGTAKYRLVPIGYNLKPIANEEYFDGLRVRKLKSGVGLKKYLLDPLQLTFTDCWITDLIKVFLYKPKHKKSIHAVHPEFDVPVLINQFYELGNDSLKWIKEEIELCKPKVIITLGLEVAQVVSGNKNAKPDEILKSDTNSPANLNFIPTVYAPHPDACRRFEKWREVMEGRIGKVKELLIV